MGFCCGGLGWGNWMGWGAGWVGPVLGLALLVGILGFVGVGAAWFVRQFRRASAPSGTADDALEIARGRLASGEISVEEFESIRQSLRAGN